MRLLRTLDTYSFRMHVLNLMCVVTEKRQIVKLQKQDKSTRNVNNSNANQRTVQPPLKGHLLFHNIFLVGKRGWPSKRMIQFLIYTVKTLVGGHPILRLCVHQPNVAQKRIISVNLVSLQTQIFHMTHYGH